MGYFEDMLENTEEHALFLEIYLEEWPALLQTTDEDKQRLYRAIEAALQAMDCPAQARKVIGDQLVIVLQMSVNRCVDEILEALETASKTALSGQGPESCSVLSMCATEVIDAVVALA